MKNRGFTLIEILLVVLLLGLSMIPFVISYQKAQQNQFLRVSSEQFADNVRSAHIYARDAKDKKEWGVIKEGSGSYLLVSGTQDSYTVEKRFELDRGIKFLNDFFIWYEIGTGETEEEREVLFGNMNEKKVAVKIYRSGVVEVANIE